MDGAGVRMARPPTKHSLIRGRIVGLEADDVLFDDRTSGRIRVPFAQIAKANLEIDIEEEFRLAAEREQQAKAHGGTTTE